MAENEKGVLGDKQLHVGHWCVLAAENANGFYKQECSTREYPLSHLSDHIWWQSRATKKKKKSSKSGGVSQLERNQSDQGEGAGAHGIQGVSKGVGFVQAREERAEGDFTAVYIY